MLKEYLFRIIVTFLMDEMLLSLQETIITYPKNKQMTFLKQVGMFIVKYIFKFIMTKIAAVTGNQFVQHVKKITYIFKKKYLHVPNSTNVV